MVEATVRLMTDGTTSDPQTIEVPEGLVAQEQAVREWAAGQTGHPWDVVTVSILGQPGYEVDLHAD